jgi:tRNA U34 5-carboxymethylaminomethyl modifying GTPase MnmE/TrmE
MNASPFAHHAADLTVLHVAVVGHTNTGKTSLLRTLTRDETFGEVSDRPATTRHVERASLMVHGQPLVELFDTPGLEDSIGLLEHLEQARAGRRVDGVDQIRTLLAAPESQAAGRFAQEAKALRQVLASDVALYVIDARDRVLGKHRDELEILARCAKPVVPVLNFTASSDAQIALWREHLSRVNMHAVAEFDTVVLDEHTERRLLEKMRTLLDRHHGTINALIEEREQLRAGLVRTSCGIIADMLIDIAAHQVSVPAQDQSEVDRAMESLRQRVREREQRCVEQLLQLHRFSNEDCLASNLPIADGKWGVDLFSPAAMKQFGIKTGSAVAAGAMVGLTIDAISHMLTLGTATAIGAAVGGAVGVAQTHGRRLLDRLRGHSDLSADDNTLRLLIARQIALLAALLRRGHASVEPIRVADSTADDASHTADRSPRRLPVEIDDIRLRPQWSQLQSEPNPLALTGQARLNAQNQLARTLENLLRQASRGSDRAQ